MRTLSATLFLTSLAALAQPARPAFDVASIKIVQPGRESIEPLPGSLSMRNVRLNACIRWAYNVQDVQVAGPAWLSEVWLDVWAKPAAPASPAEMRQMLQTLLAERFKLAFHRETRDMPALVLTVGKGGHKLKPVEAEGSPSFSTGKLNLTGKGATIAQLTDFLARELRNPVIDQTGLSGRFDYFLDINAYVTDEMRKNAGDGPPLEAPAIIANAMHSQLGLKVDAKKVPIEVLVIDHLEKTPTDN